LVHSSCHPATLPSRIRIRQNAGQMCAQCMATAAVAVGGASGLRAWLAAKRFAWLTPTRMRAATIVLVVAAVLASATLSGSSS
jgi:hypothetical protein